jgi:hypothetical protein
MINSWDNNNIIIIITDWGTFAKWESKTELSSKIVDRTRLVQGDEPFKTFV